MKQLPDLVSNNDLGYIPFFWGGRVYLPKITHHLHPPRDFFHGWKAAKRSGGVCPSLIRGWSSGNREIQSEPSSHHVGFLKGFKKKMTQQQDISGDSVPLFVFLRFLNCHQLFVGCSSIHPGFQSQTLTSDELQPVVIRLQVMGWWEWWEIVE